MKNKNIVDKKNKTRNKKGIKKIFVFCYISIVIIISIIAAGLLWQYTIEQNSEYKPLKLKIAFITDNNEYNKELYKKISLDDYITVDRIKESEVDSNTLENYDIVIISNVNLKSSTRTYIGNYIKESDDNSVIFLIDDKTDGDDLQYLNITKNSDLKQFKGESDLGYGICKDTGEEKELTKNIPWNTLPEVRNFTYLIDSDFYKDDADKTAIILKDYSTKESDDIFLFYKDLKNGGKYLIFTLWFDAPLNKDEITANWPYMGYFFYSCFVWLKNEPIPTYREWPHSPVPRMNDIWIIALIFGGLAISSFLMYIYASKYSEKHPLEKIVALETEEEIEAKKKAEKKIEKLIEEDKDNQAKEKFKHVKEFDIEDEKFSYEEIEAELPDYLKGWNAVGAHRQVGGFWTIFFIALILILPAAGFLLWFFPAVIFPTPSGQGFYKITVDLFEALWILMNLGTDIWLMRKFAAYRISEPDKAIKAAQCYVWFQVLTGAYQIILVGFLGAIGFPSTIYAHLTYVFIWYSLFQWLGFYMVFIYIINSLQRTDVAGVSVAAMAPLLVIFQIVLVPLFIWYGKNNPAIGVALGGAMGAAFANFVTNLGMFFISWIIFRKTFKGTKGTSIFRVDFDGELFKDMIKFGAKYTPGNVLVPLVWTLQTFLLTIYLDNYSNWLGYWNIAYTVSMVAYIIAAFAASFIPSFSEALENNKYILLNYNINTSLKWTNNFNFWLSSAMFAVSVPLILAITPPEFKSVALLMPLLIVFQLLGPYSWLGDAVFGGTNHPAYATAAWVLEQSIRAILLIIIIPLLAINPKIGIFCVLFAYIPALITKNIFMWMIIKKKIIPDLKIYPFKTFIAPILAGVAFFFITGFILILALTFTGSELISAIIGAIFSLVLGPFVYFFLSGLFGGWSKNGLEEFKRSTSIMTIAGKISKILYKACLAGAKLSPWREKGNIKLYNQARIEAWELTLLKKKLENF
ncbi:MAG: hypothetical protein ACTSQP_13455 [Promethearchaeota archaeon]